MSRNNPYDDLPDIEKMNDFISSAIGDHVQTLDRPPNPSWDWLFRKRWVNETPASARCVVRLYLVTAAETGLVS